MSNYNDLIDKKYKSIASIPDGLLSFTKKIRLDAIGYLNLKEGDKVIDVGCGTGASFPFLEEVVGKSGRILGVEPSTNMIKGAEARVTKEKWGNITLVENRIEEVASDETFDGALLFAMHDVFNSSEGLEKIQSLLKEGARVVCVGPKIQENGFTRVLNPFLHLLFKRMAFSQENKDQPWRLVEKVFLTDRIILEKHGLIFIYVGQKVNKIDGDTKFTENWMEPAPQSSHHKFLNGIRYFNKYVFNHLTLLFAGSNIGPFSKLSHKGRKSGKVFHTPVVATYNGETVIIPLSYGEHVDWLRNILAAGGCEIIYRKNRIITSNPEVVTREVALLLLPEKRRRIFKRFKLEKFLRMQIINQ